MCGTTYSSLQSSDTLNYRRMITHRASESLYCIPLRAVNGLSRLTKLTTSKGAGTADSIRKFSNRPIPFESNQMAHSNYNRILKLGRSLHVYTVKPLRYVIWTTASKSPVSAIGSHLYCWTSETQPTELRSPAETSNLRVSCE